MKKVGWQFDNFVQLSICIIYMRRRKNMGRKYTSFHLLDTCTQQNDQALLDRYLQLTGQPTTTLQLDGLENRVRQYFAESGWQLSPSLSDELSSLLHMDRMELTEAKCTRNGNCLSIYDRSIGFDCVEETAQSCSEEFNTDVLFASVFDDDVFIFGLCSGGQTRSMHISGSVDVYGLRESHMNPEDLCALAEKYCREIDASMAELKGEAFEQALQRIVPFSLHE